MSETLIIDDVPVERLPLPPRPHPTPTPQRPARMPPPTPPLPVDAPSCTRLPATAPPAANRSAT